jgi:hypothetical protein
MGRYSKLIKLLWVAFALKEVCNLFMHDAHHIVSKRGWIKLNEDEEVI